MESNKVSVKIYGQEYVISGAKSREHIIKVAAYVDNKMHEIAKAAPSCSMSDLAVLSAVNIADEKFEAGDEAEELKKLNVQLEKDAQHYVQLWDEAKKNHIQYKDETQGILQMGEDLRKELAIKEQEILEMKKAEEDTIEQLKIECEKVLSEADAQCKELENSFFDLQMENLQLKKELETLKRNAE
jgi:cell division protein ZapA